MRIARLAMLAAAILAAIPAPAHHNAPLKNKSLLLPEVQKHLDDAKDCAANGTPQVAAAHADLILLGDEVTYNIQFLNVPDRLRSRSA